MKSFESPIHPHNDLTLEENKFLLFQLGPELYGSKLLEIKEVIKLPTLKSVPYMVSYFKGVVNLRGQIISIIDLREKFKIPIISHTSASTNTNSISSDTEFNHELVLIVETKDGHIGVIVDNISSVECIPPEDIECNPPIETQIPSKFLMGIGKHKDRLINLIYLSQCIASDEMRTIYKESKEN